MLLKDIPIGSHVFIEVKSGNSILEFQSEVCRDIIDKEEPENSCYVRTFTSNDGRILNFDSIDVNAYITPLNSDVSYVFDIEQLTHVIDKESDAHLLVSINEGKIVNRRGAVRVPMQVKAIVSYIDKNKIAYGITKDISASGIAIIIDEKDLEAEPGGTVKISFTGPDKIRYSIRSKVVRLQYIDDSNMVLLGCQFDKEDSSICNLVNQIQIKMNNIHY